MERNQKVSGIILKSSRIGEIHKGLTLFTENKGIINCIAHGAWKTQSKLRSSTQLFSYSELFLYDNPVKQSIKVTDIKNINLFEGIKTNIEKFYIASLWSEVILKSFGGGESTSLVFKHFLNAMTILSESDIKDDGYLMLQFLWRFLIITGHKPELCVCSSCGKGVETNDSLFFQSGAFICEKCTSGKPLPLHTGTRIYLEKTMKIGLREAITIKIEKSSLETLKQIIFNMLEYLLEIRLNSIKSGEGLI